MNYRIRFRKVTKWQKFKDFNKKVFAAIKTFIINKFSGVKVLVQKVKNFNERINYSRLFNRIGIFILFLVPIFICLILCLYSLIWLTVFLAGIFGHTWKQLADIMPMSIGSIILNLIIIFASFSSMWSIINSALDKLNSDLSSIKAYLVSCILPMIICGIIYFVLLYKPAYDLVCTVLQWIFITIIVCIVLAILGKLFSSSPAEEFDIIQIKLPKR